MRVQAPRVAAAASGLVLLAGLLTGCGSGSGASTEDFCDAAENLQAAGDMENDTTSEIQAVKQAYDDLVEVGTPDDMPDDAREGIEVLGQALDGLDDDASEAELQKFDESIGDAGLEKTEAFFVYVAKNCTMGGNE